MDLRENNTGSLDIANVELRAELGPAVWMFSENWNILTWLKADDAAALAFAAASVVVAHAWLQFTPPLWRGHLIEEATNLLVVDAVDLANRPLVVAARFNKEECIW